MAVHKRRFRTEFVEYVEEVSGEKVLGCYQCGRCSAGCPMVDEVDMLPHQILRLLQLGREDEVLEKNTMWLCAACHTCASRCPRGVDLARIMEALRVAVLRTGSPKLHPKDLPKEVLEKAPQQAFVSGYRKLGT